MNSPAVAVLSGSLVIRLSPQQLQSLLQQWKQDGKPGNTLTLQLLKK